MLQKRGDNNPVIAFCCKTSEQVCFNFPIPHDPRGNMVALDFLKSPAYPAVQMVFYGNFGKRLVLFGQLWSLGNFTGTISLILPDRQTDLATFRMKKD